MLPVSSQILTGKELTAPFGGVEKNVYIRASPLTIDLYIEGIVIKIQSTVRIVLWKRKSLVMTMMASFLSNINIPAWSLFPPRAKSLFHFESSLWMLEMLPWYFFPLLFICLYPGDVPTCHIKHTQPYFLRAKVKTIVTGRVGGVIDHTHEF